MAYALDHCLDTPPATAYVGVVLDSQGNLQSDLAILSSSGYAILDEAARATIQQHDFSPPAELTAYSIEVEIENYPDDCPERT
ncbi:hypothetical protein XM38_031990 [Halomicronema hongdechloris C2206]|uniref:TonB C-terminal domain-containing protein n=1 Tax=Halomicronema hongdechloris C2206 TaxID=1641165 RepID=A0A1Z3HPL3_9CYAN|nr:TonB family protein [Halomicronema hongdechloris]ASC72244.1 hypothetical protein XM38_031990 [Halomicronema hongdechloris C2206]